MLEVKIKFKITFFNLGWFLASANNFYLDVDYSGYHKNLIQLLFLISVKYSGVNNDLVHVLGVFSSLTVLRIIASSTWSYTATTGSFLLTNSLHRARKKLNSKLSFGQTAVTFC